MDNFRTWLNDNFPEEIKCPFYKGDPEKVELSDLALAKKKAFQLLSHSLQFLWQSEEESLSTGAKSLFEEYTNRDQVATGGDDFAFLLKALKEKNSDFSVLPASLDKQLDENLETALSTYSYQLYASSGFQFCVPDGSSLTEFLNTVGFGSSVKFSSIILEALDANQGPLSDWDTMEQQWIRSRPFISKLMSLPSVAFEVVETKVKSCLALKSYDSIFEFNEGGAIKDFKADWLASITLGPVNPKRQEPDGSSAVLVCPARMFDRNNAGELLEHYDKDNLVLDGFFSAFFEGFKQAKAN